MEALYEEENDQSSLHKSANYFDRLSRKLRKSLIVAFTSSSKQSKSYRLNIFLSLCLAFVSMMQAMSLILQRNDDIGEYAALQKVFALVNYIRFDTLAYDLGVITEFFYCTLAAIYTPLAILFVNVSLHMYLKRVPNELSVKVMAIVLNLLEQILLVPSLVLMLVIVKYAYLTSDSQMIEYGGGEVIRNGGLAAVSLATIPTLIALLYVNSYFFYDNIFAKRRKLVYSMRDSLVHRAHIVARIGMVLCYCFLSMQSEIWYRVGIMLLCVMMYMFYSTQLSYFNLIMNIVNASKKAILIWTVISYLVGLSCNSATVIFIMVLFVSPLLITLIYFRVQEKMVLYTHTRLEDISTAFQVEIKLRHYLETLECGEKDQHDAVHANVERLFQYATRQFLRSPLLPLWEALYYYHYRRNAFTALLKLSKAHVADSTIESQFFINKTERKLLDIERSPERLYLRYLKLLDEAKRADESCCLLLVNVCTELLSRKLDSSKFDSYVKKLSMEIDKTTGKYFRILQLYNDSESVLDLLGSFMFDVLKESEGKNYSTKAKMLRNNETRRGSTLGGNMNSLLCEQSGLMVVSCCIQFPGEIVLANQAAFDLLKCSKIDLINKSLKPFLPEVFRPIFTPTLSKAILYGTFLDSISQLFALILDSEGFLVPTSIITKVTTWNNKPYILLMLEPKGKVDLVLVDAQFRIKAHSKVISAWQSEANVSYIGCQLDEMLPVLEERLREGEEDFLYQPDAINNYIVSIQKVDFQEIHCLLLTLQPVLKSSRHSTINSLITKKRQREENKKGVRFTAEESMLMVIDSKHEGLLSSQEHNQTALYTETEMRMRKKYEITTSVATSSSLSLSSELMQGVEVAHKVKRVRLLLMLSFLLMVTGLTASVIFVVDILNSLKSIATIRDYSERNFEVIQLAYDTRSLMLSDDSINFPYDHDSVSTAIQSTSDSLDKLIEFMKSLVGKGSKEADVYLTQQKVPMWFQLESSYEFRKLTLLDALYSYTTASSRLVTAAGPYTHQPDAFYVYRNGAADLLSVTNLTLSIRVHGEEVIRINSLAIIEYLIFMCAALIVLPLLFLVAPQFFLFERVSRSIWVEIYHLPRELVLDVRNVAGDRLMHFFSNEILLETTTALKQTHHSAKPTKLWPELLGKVSVYLLLNVVFFVVIEVVYFMPVKELALTIPNYLYWMAMRPRLLQDSLFWSRERLLNDTQESVFSLVPEGQLYFSAALQVSNVSSTISFINKLLNFGDAAYGVTSIKKSASYIDYVLLSTCDQTDYSGCADSELGYGLTYGIKEWNQRSKALLRETYPLPLVFPLFARLEASTTDLLTATNHAINFYETDAIQQIDTISVQVVTLTVLFIFTVFLLYFVLYSPTLAAMLRKARQAIRVQKMLKNKVG